MKARRRKITLLYLGGSRPKHRLINLDLFRLAKFLNRLRGQSSFEFAPRASGVNIAYDLKEPKPNELGGPDYRESMYIINPLLERLDKDWAPAKEGDDSLVVGIIRSPLTQDEEYADQGGSALGEEYFSLSDFRRCAVITTSRAMLEKKPRGKTVEQYVAYLMAAELVNMISAGDRMHPGDAPCLFNDCVDRTMIAECMDTGGFCSICAEKIRRSEWTIPATDLGSINAILEWCMTDSLRYTAREVLTHPLKSVSIAGAAPVMKCLIGFAASSSSVDDRLAGVLNAIVGSIAWDLSVPIVVFLVMFLVERRASRSNHE